MIRVCGKSSYYPFINHMLRVEYLAQHLSKTDKE